MIQELFIKNFAIIEEVRCQFEKGMTVLTGETGAGKSIIIDAVGLLAGERASLEMIRYGSEKATIQAVFTIDSEETKRNIEALGIEIENDEIMIQRELYQTGKSTCRINGQMVTVSLLKQVGPYLIDIHGQNEHFLLLNEEHHLSLLDAYAGQKLQSLKDSYSEYYEHFCSIQDQLRKLQTAEKEDAQKIDLLKFQVEEIELSNIYIGEEEELVQEKEYFTHFQKIQEHLMSALSVLQTEEYSAVDAISQASQEIGFLEGIGENYKQLHQQLQESYYQLQDAVSNMSHELDHAEYDEERLAYIEERLDVYYQLKRKYGDNAEEILEFQAQAQAQLNQIENKESIIETLIQEKAQIEQKAKEVARELTKQRQAIALELAEKIETQLHELYMEQAIFEIRVLPTEQLLETGMDEVYFYISTNKGEPVKPLQKIVSGGELSRITLAMKTIFVRKHGVGTIVFDEVDTGVSGRVAQAIANKMHYISEFAQVLCITHLPQVASIAGVHIFIEKMEKDERTRTTLTTLEEEKRIEEIGRMLSGEEMTALTKQHAAELIALSQKIRQQNKDQKKQVIAND